MGVLGRLEMYSRFGSDVSSKSKRMPWELEYES